MKIYFSDKQHKKVAASLQSRFQNARAVPNIQKQHAFISVGDKNLILKGIPKRRPNSYAILSAALKELKKMLPTQSA